MKQEGALQKLYGEPLCLTGYESFRTIGQTDPNGPEEWSMMLGKIGLRACRLYPEFDQYL